MELVPWHRRIRWANVARLAAALGVVAVVAAWPHLAPNPPAVPAGTPRPVAGSADGRDGITAAELRSPAEHPRTERRRRAKNRARRADRRPGAKRRHERAGRRQTAERRGGGDGGRPTAPAPAVTPAPAAAPRPAARPATASAREFVFG